MEYNYALDDLLLFPTLHSHSIKADSSSEYELTQRVELSGAVESLTFVKVVHKQSVYQLSGTRGA